MARKVLVSITTTTTKRERNGQSLAADVAEAKRLGLKELAFFPTCLAASERQEAYTLLGQIPDLQIPFVHARNDMSVQEFHLLQTKFGTKRFNLHSPRYHLFPQSHDSLKGVIAIENAGPELQPQDVQGFAGLCLDLSHLETDRRLQRENYEQVLSLVKTYGVKANHISASGDEAYLSSYDPFGQLHYDKHWMDKLSEIDYIKNYPEECFGEFVAIELENPLAEQLKIKERIEQLCPFLC